VGGLEPEKTAHRGVVLPSLSPVDCPLITLLSSRSFFPSRSLLNKYIQGPQDTLQWVAQLVTLASVYPTRVLTSKLG